MNTNEQLEQNIQTNIEAQNVQIQQPVQQSQPQPMQPVQSAHSTNDAVPIAKGKQKKRNNKTLILILLIVVLLGGAYFLFSNKTGNGKKLSLTGGSNEVIKVDTGKKWGDVFADYLQRFYKELYEDQQKLEEDGVKVEKNREYEITFIDFDFDNTPEMVVKYVDFSGLVTYRFFMYNNEEVSETKDFRNVTFKIIYSLKEKTADWYLYISSANKTGAYTSVNKILSGKAYDSDIKAYTDRDITNFNKNYATSDYKVTLYRIDDNTYAEDFKIAVDKYEENNKEIKAKREKLINDYANVEVKEEVQINKDPRIELGEYTLEFGKYAYDCEIYENGKVVRTEKVYISINRDWTATIEDKSVKYNIYGNSISLENGLTIKANKNNEFTYGIGEGNVYKLVE